MSERKAVSPFAVKKTFEGKKDFDKYYIDVTEKEIFKPTGEIDPDTGEALGVVERKLLLKKVDIHEALEAQRDTVGIEAYKRALLADGVVLDECNTSVSEEIQDFSNMPEDLSGVLQAGDAAKAAFANIDPSLRGDHTTIEGFLNDLTQEKVDAYIKARVDALTPKQTIKEGE